MQEIVISLQSSLIRSYIWSILTLLGLVLVGGVLTGPPDSTPLPMVLFLWGLGGSIVIWITLLFYAVPVHLFLKRNRLQYLWCYCLAALLAVLIFLLVFRPFPWETFQEFIPYLFFSSAIAFTGTCAFWWDQVGKIKYYRFLNKP